MGDQLNRTLLALAGEFAVASQLCLKRYVANLTLKNYPGVDIFAYDTKSEKTIALQVKTALERREKSFTATHPFIVANASKDQLDDVLEEKIKLPHVFVYISAERTNVRFFIVPPGDVRNLAKNDFMRWWWKAKHRRPLNDLSKVKQPLTIPLDELEPYENRWELLS